MLRNQARSVGDQGSGFCVLFLFSRLFFSGGLWCFYLLLLFSYVFWSCFFLYITVLSLCLVSFIFVIQRFYFLSFFCGLWCFCLLFLFSFVLWRLFLYFFLYHCPFFLFGFICFCHLEKKRVLKIRNLRLFCKCCYLFI